MQRSSSGISALDRHLGGGLPRTPNIVVSGSQQDVYLFSQRLVWNRLNVGDTCLYATLSRTRDDVCRDLISKGWDVSPFITGGILRIVDYLSLVDTNSTTTEEKLIALLSLGTNVLTPERFNQILERELHYLREKAPMRRSFAIFESVDRLVDAIGLENTLRFAEMAFKTLRENNSMAVALLSNEFISEETVKMAKSMASVFMELNRKEKGADVHRMVRVTKPRMDSPNDWIPWHY